MRHACLFLLFLVSKEHVFWMDVFFCKLSKLFYTHSITPRGRVSGGVSLQCGLMSEARPHMHHMMCIHVISCIHPFPIALFVSSLRLSVSRPFRPSVGLSHPKTPPKSVWQSSVAQMIEVFVRNPKVISRIVQREAFEMHQILLVSIPCVLNFVDDSCRLYTTYIGCGVT